MTACLSAIAKSRWLPRLIVIAASLTPIACSALTPACSDAQVGARIKELALQILQQNYGLTTMYDLPATRFDLRAIRTSEADDRRSTCRADLAIEFELRNEIKAAMAKPGGNPTEIQLMKSMLGNTSRSIDLRYSVELTDDGRELYVSIQRF